MLRVGANVSESNVSRDREGTFPTCFLPSYVFASSFPFYKGRGTVGGSFPSARLGPE